MKLTDLPDAHLRVFERPTVPPPVDIRSIYLIGICGTGMGALASLLQNDGYAVSGADQAVYPPMSTRLAEAGIAVHEGFDPAHLTPAPDLVVVGNACTPTHPEAAYAREQRLVQQSFPEALAHFYLQKRRPLVIAGTHGKTTTTGLLIHLLREAGRDPGYLVGGVMQGGYDSAHAGNGPHFVVEGDEYDCAYFDKRPKFMHYRPASAVVTSLELDHTDIYPDWPAYHAAFEAFVRLVPADGLLALCGDHAPVRALAEAASCRTITYGLHPENALTAEHVAVEAGGQAFDLVLRGEPRARMRLPMHGRQNLGNALAAIALALDEGLGIDEAAAALATFPGMLRRQQVLGDAGGIRVLDDFAHHPTAVGVTIEGVRDAHPGRRIVAVFEPRSNTSRRKDFEQAYIEALAAAEVAFLSTPPFRHNDDAANFLDPTRVIEGLDARGCIAASAPNADALLPRIVDAARPGDVILIMSNGGFGGLHRRLLDALA